MCCSTHGTDSSQEPTNYRFSEVHERCSAAKALLRYGSRVATEVSGITTALLYPRRPPKASKTGRVMITHGGISQTTPSLLSSANPLSGSFGACSATRPHRQQTVIGAPMVLDLALPCVFFRLRNWSRTLWGDSETRRGRGRESTNGS